MKPDERFAITHLEQYLGLGTLHKFFDGRNPPDCFGIFFLQRIGVEITRIGPLHIEQNRTITKRDFDYPISQWTAKAREEVSCFVPQDSTLFCHVKGPIEKFAKFKKEFPKSIKTLLEKTEIKYQTKEFKIASASVDLSLRPRNASSLRVIITSGIVEHNLPLQCSLDIQASGSIDMALTDKRDKCKNYKERLWLLLINTHPLLDHADLERVDKKLFQNTPFEKVYVVDPHGEILPIFAKKSSPLRYLRSFLGWCCSKIRCIDI